jgi:hypothetical protein
MRGDRVRQAVADEARDVGRRVAVTADLVTGVQRHVVDLLERPLAPARGPRAPAEHEHRRVVLLRARHRAHPVRDAGAGGQRRDAGFARHLGPALGANVAADSSRVSTMSMLSARQPS